MILVGCGGTGSLVADGLCRLLVKNDIPLFIVDPDIVEEHNLLRQAFYKEDLGKFKAQVIAERCARLYGRKIGYSIWPFEKDIAKLVQFGGRSPLAQNSLIIGCVDNAEARKDIAKCMEYSSNWWLDAGNSYNSGQVLIGNANHLAVLNGAFDEQTGIVDNIPCPSMQSPTLLIPQVQETRQIDCAQAVRDNSQSSVINQAMAMLVLEIIRRIMIADLTWMGIYLDMELGSMKPVPADPVTIARMFSVKVNSLMHVDNKKGKNNEN